MNTIPTRCRYYNDNGQPIDNGCFKIGTSCNFTHPSDSGWATARPFVRDSGYGGRGGGRGRGRGGGSRGGGGGSSAWQSGSDQDWGHPPAPPKQTATASEDLAWGNNSTGDNAGGWGVAVSTSTSDSGEAPAWGAESGDSVWGSAWGAAVPGSTSDAGEVPAWGVESTPASEGGAWNGPPKDSTDAVSKDKPIPPRIRSISGASQKKQSSDAPLSANSHQDISVEKPPSPTASRLSTKDARRPRAKNAPVGPTERRKVWDTSVQMLVNAILAQIKLADDEKTREKCKRLQESHQYSRPSETGRDKLNALRLSSKEDVEKGKIKIAKILDELVDLPEMDRDFIDLTGKVDEEEVVSYIAEMKDYIQDIRPLLMEVITTTPLVHHAPAPEDGEYSAKRPRSKSAEPPQPNHVQYISELQSRIEELEANLELSTTPSVKAQLEQVLEDKIRAVREAEEDESSSLNPVNSLRRKASEFGVTLVKQADTTAHLITSADHQDKELALIKTANAEHAREIAQHRETMADIMKQQEEVSARNLEMFNNMQILLGNKPPPPFTLSGPVLSQVGAFTNELIREDLQPAIFTIERNIMQQIKRQHEQICDEVWSSLQRPLELTERIHPWLDKEMQKGESGMNVR